MTRWLSALIGMGMCWALIGCATSPRSNQPAECPTGRSYGDLFCSSITTYARDPDTGQCCRYQSACATPAGWKTFTSEAACQTDSSDN